MYAGLPNICYGRLKTDNFIIIIKKGESGYYKCDFPKENDIDFLNERLGVTKAQAAAMQAGSMFGWNVPLANPAMYDENGKVNKVY